MQPWGEDYYMWAEQEGDPGCCLLCEEAHPGCLCYECNCKKCYWYIPLEEYNHEKGRCGYVYVLRKKREKNYNFRINDYSQPQLIDDSQKQIKEFGME